jgi:hypothetical protein
MIIHNKKNKKIYKLIKKLKLKQNTWVLNKQKIIKQKIESIV